MPPTKLLLADQNEDFIRSVTAYLSLKPDIVIAGACKSGEELLSRVCSERPDVILMELILEGMDGISVLKSIRGMKNRPSVIVCTEFFNEITIRRVRQCGASGFMCKPVSRDSLYDAIVESVDVSGEALSPDEFTYEDSADGVPETLENYLSSLGVSRRAEGFKLICDAAFAALRRPELLTSMTKLLYPEVARMHDSTSARVERNIRTAIAQAHESGTLKLGGRRPTNREFISRLVERITGSSELI